MDTKSPIDNNNRSLSTTKPINMIIRSESPNPAMSVYVVESSDVSMTDNSIDNDELLYDMQMSYDDQLINNGKPMKQTRTNRLRFSIAQINELEIYFNRIPYPHLDERRRLASLLTVSLERLTIWFQNRRAKTRRLNKANNSNGAIHALSLMSIDNCLK